jgi:hypothetical protein
MVNKAKISYHGNFNIQRNVEGKQKGESVVIVHIKKFDVDMMLKTNGIEFEVRENDDTHIVDMIVNKRGLIWCEGITSRANSVQKDWNDVITLFKK